MIKQVLGRVAVVPKGEWAEGSLYTRLDVVMHGGRGWICAAADTTTEEPGAGAGWQLIAEKGDPFTYGDFTEEQVAGLMKPATDAAAEIAKTDGSYRAMLEQQAADFSAAQAGRKSAFEEAEINRANSFMQAEALRNATFNERERGRISAEGSRARAEAERADAEAARAEAERGRVKAESQRDLDFEAAQDGNAKAFSDAQVARETAFERAEAERAGKFEKAEKARSEAEGERVSAEGKRAQAETDRVKAEEARAKAEGDRSAAWSKLKADSENATSSANDAAESASIAAADARAAASEVRGNPPELVWDESKQRYTKESAAAMAHSHRDGKIYGIKIPKGAVTECVKIGAAEGIAAPVPGVIGTPCADPFATGKGPHWHMVLNGDADPDGAPYIDGVPGDARFSLTDNGKKGAEKNNVYTLYNVIWNKFQEDFDPDYIWWFYSDTRKAGYDPNPQAFLPDGTLRDFMLTPTYPASKDADGDIRSVSGAPVWNRTLSHDSGIDACKSGTTGVSLKSVYDDWILKFSYVTRYGTKNVQKYFAGCSSYNVQVKPVLAESGVKRVVLKASDAAQFLDGSCVSLGTHDTGNSGTSVGNDRGTAKNYDVFDMKRILSRETLADGNVALNIECDSAFDTGTDYLLSTMPWWTGATDSVEGDGSPSSNASGKEPCKIGGIEVFVGANEIVGGAMQKSTGNGWYLWLNPDSRNEKKNALAEGAVETGVRVQDDNVWTLCPTNAHGMLVGTGSGGNSNAGNCDGGWNSKPTDTGLREYLSLGVLWSGSNVGLWCFYGGNWPDWAGWNVCSRRSVTGRGGEEAQAA